MVDISFKSIQNLNAVRPLKRGEKKPKRRRDEPERKKKGENERKEGGIDIRA